MKTVLIGWELGAGRGHVERLVPIVSAYRARGWRVIAALRDAQLGADILGPSQRRDENSSLTIVRAPIFSHTDIDSGPVNSIAEILAKTGFSRPEFVRPLLANWDAMLARYQPDIVISDCAPSLNTVARGKVPLTVIGNGWTLPPDSDLPLALTVEQGGEGAIRDAGEAVLTAMYAASPFSPEVQRFTDLLRGDHNLACTLAEIDPYRAIRDELLYWPFEISAPTARMEQSRSGGLIYLPKRHPARGLVEREAGRLNMQFDAYFNGPPMCRSRSVAVHVHPIDFGKVIHSRQLVIHHGGLGTTTWCMANRVPQLIFPHDLEKMLIAKGVVEGGYGYAISSQAANLNFKAAVEATINLTVPEFDIGRMATLSPEASIDAITSGPHQS